jgi:hypothetical protein
MQAKFQDTVGSIAHQLDRAVRKPSAHWTDHLMRPHSYPKSHLEWLLMVHGFLHGFPSDHVYEYHPFGDVTVWLPRHRT